MIGRLVMMVSLVMLLFVPNVQAATTPDAAAQAALKWLVARQQADGSFPGFDAGASADAIFALVAAGTDPNTVQKNKQSAVSYLETQAASYGTKSPAAAGKLALAAVASGKDPRNFGGQNLLDVIGKGYNASSKLYGTTPTDHAFAVLALASSGQTLAKDAAAGFSGTQLKDGGWSFDGLEATGSDTNTTALAVQAMAAAKISGEPMTKAMAYLQSQQNADGGFPYSKTSSFGADSDANSTAAVIQAMIASGAKPETLAQGKNTPLTALVALQNANGAFRYQKAMAEDNDLATAQAVPALLGKALPLTTTALPAAAPPQLPSTGAASPVWLWLAALVLLTIGALLKRRLA